MIQDGRALLVGASSRAIGVLQPIAILYEQEGLPEEAEQIESDAASGQESSVPSGMKMLDPEDACSVLPKRVNPRRLLAPLVRNVSQKPLPLIEFRVCPLTTMRLVYGQKLNWPS